MVLYDPDIGSLGRFYVLLGVGYIYIYIDILGVMCEGRVLWVVDVL